MKRSALIVLVMIMTNFCFAQQAFYDVTAAVGNGLRFYSANSFKIHMGGGAEYRYGPVTDYSIKTNMDTTPGRGWTWGIDGATPVAAIGIQGDMKIAGTLTLGKLYSLGPIAVQGLVDCQEVKVELTVAPPDYVFAKDYNLAPLAEVKTYIEDHHHLSEIPSAKEMETNGVKMGEMNMLLLKKVEELTLYILEQEQRIKVLEEKTR